MKKKIFGILIGAIVFATSVMPCFAFETMKKGDKNDSVAEVQEMLITLGYLEGTADGVFGNGTEKALQEYQTENNWDSTGVVDETLYNSLLKSTEEFISVNTPEGMVIDEEKWKEWKSENECMLFPFMGGVSLEGSEFSFTIPTGQAASDHKTVSFIFKDGESSRTLDNVEMYYAVENQKIIYTGLNTADKSVFESDDFKEACIRLMLGYDISYDSEKQEAVPNLSREQAEEVVEYCLKNVEHCLFDGMRIRVVRTPATGEKEAYYSFHMEY